MIRISYVNWQLFYIIKSINRKKFDLEWMIWIFKALEEPSILNIESSISCNEAQIMLKCKKNQNSSRKAINNYEKIMIHSVRNEVEWSMQSEFQFFYEKFRESWILMQNSFSHFLNVFKNSLIPLKRTILTHEQFHKFMHTKSLFHWFPPTK